MIVCDGLIIIKEQNLNIFTAVKRKDIYDDSGVILYDDCHFTNPKVLPLRGSHGNRK